MTQTIEQLTARVRELEEENARLKREDFSHERIQNDTLKLQNRVLYEKMIEAQAYTEQLREAIDRVRSGAAALGLDRIFDIATEALAIPRDTSALDAYVSEKVREYGDEARRQMQHATKAVWQRDLAIEALEDVRKELQQSNDRLYEEREIWDRVMGDGVKKLERLELELDDCLYVLESLWDKTCNKEVTEKWAGILIRNKRGIGASSAEDSSEQTTA